MPAAADGEMSSSSSSSSLTTAVDKRAEDRVEDAVTLGATSADEPNGSSKSTGAANVEVC